MTTVRRVMDAQVRAVPAQVAVAGEAAGRRVAGVAADSSRMFLALGRH